MEYQLELSPLQIRLNLEVYSALHRIFNMKIDEQEIEKIKKGVQIIDIDSMKHLTTIDISYESQMIKPTLLKKIDFFLKENALEEHLQDVSTYFIKMSKDDSDVPELCEYLPYYFKEISNTLLIDIFSEHFGELIRYIIKMALRKEYIDEEIEILSNDISNKLLITEIDLSYLNKYLEGKYWTSSRHLGLVSNNYKPLSNQIKSLNSSSNQHLIRWILNHIPSDISESFQLYLKYIRTLNNYKIIDAQIQIQSAFLLKQTIKNFIDKKALNIDYIWDVDNINGFVEEILESCKDSI